jgi:HrpA-like RNA helicase
MLSQFVLVTGETGCGKSTQVPRLIYEYLRGTAAKGKIMCVQPRRLAVLNLFSIMNSQMPEKDMIGYQIGMTSRIHPDNRIVFVTNGIFLQRLVHSTDFFEEYPFIILDEVHERDIDTDFILLTLKRLIRNHPRVRIILMSATIDNELFRFYFASDHIDNILREENFYKKILQAQQKPKRQAQRNTQEDGDEDEEDDEVEIDSDNEEALYKAYGFEFMRAKHPCPAINVTEPGRYKRSYYYLDSMQKFLREGTANSRWGGVIFSDKYPCAHKELH